DVLARDPSLDRLGAVGPSGVAVDEPLGEGPPGHARGPNSRVDDRGVARGGGRYDWLDPLPPVRAMRLVQERRPDVKLLFATNRGAHGGPLGGKGREALALAKENGTL